MTCFNYCHNILKTPVPRQALFQYVKWIWTSWARMIFSHSKWILIILLQHFYTIHHACSQLVPVSNDILQLFLIGCHHSELKKKMPTMYPYGKMSQWSPTIKVLNFTQLISFSVCFAEPWKDAFHFDFTLGLFLASDKIVIGSNGLWTPRKI